ncbi:hypothetical protein [Nocardiopsis metallicus]|uniref:Uncharacterized protein n=1 Tax=Nocardiopsis metallicus TaxID=179819 RepID=A0A840W8C2_9ACTN|nr:hypothetical protein [Nocardiopsis metallicus]MBB5491623.1 hypothetical protein [Nocardiopsis metallicus]
MPLHREFHKTQPQKLPAGSWRSLRFDVDDQGREGEFYALVGQGEPQGALYDLSVGVVLDEVDPGSEVQLRASEYVRTRDGWEVARDRPIDSPVHAGGKAHFTYSWKDYLEPGRRVRIRLAQYGRSPAVILRAEATAFYWPEGGFAPEAQPVREQAGQYGQPAPYGQSGYYGQSGQYPTQEPGVGQPPVSYPPYEVSGGYQPPADGGYQPPRQGYPGQA